jgi:hypothetical protein
MTHRVFHTRVRPQLSQLVTPFELLGVLHAGH